MVSGWDEGLPLGGFDGFADAHPLILKMLDVYRMHLWGDMAIATTTIEFEDCVFLSAWLAFGCWVICMDMEMQGWWIG